MFVVERQVICHVTLQYIFRNFFVELTIKLLTFFHTLFLTVFHESWLTRFFWSRSFWFRFFWFRFFWFRFFWFHIFLRFRTFLQNRFRISSHHERALNLYSIRCRVSFIIFRHARCFFCFVQCENRTFCRWVFVQHADKFSIHYRDVVFDWRQFLNEWNHRLYSRRFLWVWRDYS